MSTESLLHQILQRLDVIEAKFESLEHHIDERLNSLENRVTILEKSMNNLSQLFLDTYKDTHHNNQNFINLKESLLKAGKSIRPLPL